MLGSFVREVRKSRSRADRGGAGRAEAGPERQTASVTVALDRAVDDRRCDYRVVFIPDWPSL